MPPLPPPLISTETTSPSHSHALRKFTLHPPSLNSPTSPITICLANSGPIPITSLTAIRNTLVASRTLALERLSICDVNRKSLVERQAMDKKALDEGAKVKELERKKKREEEEKRDREKVEQSERDRLERERQVLVVKKQQEEAYEKVRLKKEEDKRIADELERAVVVRRAIEANEKKKVIAVLELVRVNEAERIGDTSMEIGSSEATEPTSPPDVSMTDIPAVDMEIPRKEFVAEGTSTLIQEENILKSQSSKKLGLNASTVTMITLASSPDPEDDPGQPKPPSRKSGLDKKKRKRDQILDSEASDSDTCGADRPLTQRIKLDEVKPSNGLSASPAPQIEQKATPTPTVVIEEAKPVLKDPLAGKTPFQRKLKDEKYIKHSIPTRPPASGTATAFYLPYHSVVPPKPITVIPIPTPKKQSEVAEDFSKAKPGTQIAHHTFHAWAEAYLRPFGEDDLAFLAPKPQDITPYVIPPLGKHYLDRWEEDDADVPIASTSYISALEPPPLLRTRPDALTEDALGMENVYLGPLSERLLAALAFDQRGEEGDLEEEENKMLTSLGMTEAPSRSGKMVGMDAVDLEERIKKELRFIGILPEEEVDWSTREDDEISSALRACQRLLHNQSSLNEARKSVLSSIVQDRMAYQDYETTRDAQERVIENGWTKRQRAGKKKTKGKEKAIAEVPKPPVSLALLGAIDKRHKLVREFKPFFEDEEDKGRFFGIPEKSIYEDLELDEVVEVEEGGGITRITGAGGGSSNINSSKIL